MDLIQILTKNPKLALVVVGMFVLSGGNIASLIPRNGEKDVAQNIQLIQKSIAEIKEHTENIKNTQIRQGEQIDDLKEDVRENSDDIKELLRGSN